MPGIVANWPQFILPSASDSKDLLKGSFKQVSLSQSTISIPIYNQCRQYSKVPVRGRLASFEASLSI
jgi:hypothetical protein